MPSIFNNIVGKIAALWLKGRNYKAASVQLFSSKAYKNVFKSVIIFTGTRASTA